MESLDENIYSEILRLSKKGDSLLEVGLVRDALLEYYMALKLLPSPVFKWEAATWLFTAIGDSYWKLQDYPRAYKAFNSALRSSGGIGNPFIHLRMGQVCFELGDNEKAVNDLMRPYMGAGEEIFEGDDPKYFQAIAELI